MESAIFFAHFYKECNNDCVILSGKRRRCMLIFNLGIYMKKRYQNLCSIK